MTGYLFAFHLRRIPLVLLCISLSLSHMNTLGAGSIISQGKSSGTQYEDRKLLQIWPCQVFTLPKPMQARLRLGMILGQPLFRVSTSDTTTTYIILTLETEGRCIPHNSFPQDRAHRFNGEHVRYSSFCEECFMSHEWGYRALP